jgi:hypothetical protein
MNNHGKLMSYLMLERRNFETEDEFRRFVSESVTQLAGDLRQFEIEVSVRPLTINTRRRHQSDWNPLHIGCE